MDSVTACIWGGLSVRFPNLSAIIDWHVPLGNRRPNDPQRLGC
jgi:hypothetical protein